MKAFMDDRFLLVNETANRLYFDYAKDMPIIDYHCHLSPQEIYEDKRFRNITEVWLNGDHYKWRALRANGVEERLVTGGEGASDYDRFAAWVKTVPATIGNPLYHWSHLELRRLFGIQELIVEKNTEVIWEKANRILSEDDFSVRGLIRRSNVEVICTTDDPTDSLEFHVLLMNEENLGFRVLPSFRPDKGLEINRSTFVPWVSKLGEVAGKDIADYDAFLESLEARVRFFHSVGGRVSDHALDYVPFAETSKQEAADIFRKGLQGQTVTREEETKYKTFTLLHLGRLYAGLGWAMQFHMNAHRNNNTRMFDRIGPDTGFDSINDNAVAYPLTKLLDALDRDDSLPKTILYSLNGARDNDLLAAIMGSFQGGGVQGKIQLGSAWWFNDTKNGMLAQMKSLANIGLISRFVGMLTDSRSFLSYPRHEYFRRILCSLLGEWAEQGEVPNDIEWLGGIVRDISYYNAKRYFGFDAGGQ